VPALTCAAATWTPLTSTYVPSNCYLDATGTNARFHWPQGVVLDGLGNLLIADRNGANINGAGGDMIRQLNLATGAVTTLAGNNELRGQGFRDGPAGQAVMGGLYSATSAWDGSTIYVTDVGYANTKAYYPATGMIQTVAGFMNTAGQGFPGNPGCTYNSLVNMGSATGTNAQLCWNDGIATDGSNNLYIYHSGGMVSKIDKTGNLNRIVGCYGFPNSNPTVTGQITGTTLTLTAVPPATTILTPGTVISANAAGVVVAPGTTIVSGSGTTYVISPSQTVPAGTVFRTLSMCATDIVTSGTTNAFQVLLRWGAQMAADPNTNNLYIADFNNQRIAMVTPGGVVTTLAGDVYYGLPTPTFAAYAATMLATPSVGAAQPKFADGMGTNAGFSAVDGVFYDGVCNCLYVADTGNQAIRRVTLSSVNNGGVVTTIAGYPPSMGILAGFLDGIGTNALFRSPDELATDGECPLKT
jgi:hypothetical protein